MKVIDLLNKIAKGEEVPKVISYSYYYNGNVLLTYDYSDDFYKIEKVINILKGDSDE